MYNGIICIDKPSGFTSFDVVGKLRGMLRQKRIGHGGTLDPLATGLLPVFLGRATRVCDIAPCQDKRYLARLHLGVVTDTQDLSGRVLERREGRVGEDALREALAALTGDILQLPPMYSAVQVRGKRLYELARKGLEVERPRRPVTVHSIQILEFDPEGQTALLDIRCSKGTYVRTLCHDAGQALGVGGAMGYLRRIEALGFSLEDCHTFEEVAAALEGEGLEGLLLPAERLFETLPPLRLNEVQSRMFLNGVRLDLGRLRACPTRGRLRVLDSAGAFLGLADALEETGELAAVKILAPQSIL